jgi:hypothetical protein
VYLEDDADLRDSWEVAQLLVAAQSAFETRLPPPPIKMTMADGLRKLLIDECGETKAVVCIPLPPIDLPSTKPECLDLQIDTCLRLGNLCHPNDENWQVIQSADLGVLDHLVPRIEANIELRKRILPVPAGWHGGNSLLAGYGSVLAGCGDDVRLEQAGAFDGPGSAASGIAAGKDRQGSRAGNLLFESDMSIMLDKYAAHLDAECDADRDHDGVQRQKVRLIRARGRKRRSARWCGCGWRSGFDSVFSRSQQISEQTNVALQCCSL